MRQNPWMMWIDESTPYFTKELLALPLPLLLALHLHLPIQGRCRCKEMLTDGLVVARV